jgi:hypothetical protein
MEDDNVINVFAFQIIGGDKMQDSDLNE